MRSAKEVVGQRVSVLCASYVVGFWVGQISGRECFLIGMASSLAGQQKSYFSPHGGSHLVKEAMGLLGRSEAPLKDGQTLTGLNDTPGQDPDWLKNKVGIHPQCLNTLNTSGNLEESVAHLMLMKIIFVLFLEKEIPLNYLNIE